jgi:hypothetical protein
MNISDACWTVRLTEGGLPLAGLRIECSGSAAPRVNLCGGARIDRRHLDDVRRRLGRKGALLDDGPEGLTP